ncbi:MAG: DUF4340 domain-containing protein [Gammaproteobacteria bacterium]|nr:DUF4340 domain-containing protein [Gammaproteobacteria bacterium]
MESSKQTIVSRRVLINIFLLGLMGIIFYFGQTVAERKAIKGQLTSLQPSAISNIKITRKGMNDIVLKKLNDHWQLTSPIKISANRFNTSQILQLATAKSGSSFAALEESLHKYGLDKPETTVQLDDISIAFGNSNPIGYRRYVLIKNTVHLIRDRHIHWLRGDSDSFISLKLLPINAKIKRIQFPEILISKNSEGQWQSSDSTLFKSMDEIQALLSAWQNTEALQVVSAPLTEDAQTIIIELQSNEIINLAFIKTATGANISNQKTGIQYQFTNSQITDFFPPSGA